jgi:EpsI family protein
MNSRPIFFGPVIVTACIAAVIAGFWPTFSNLVGFSENAEGSTHTTFVLAAFGVLLWGSRGTISSLPIRPFFPGILGLFIAGLVWLIGEIIFARVLTNIGIVVMIPMFILTILGYAWLKALSFPLAFLILAVPVGGSIVPILVNWTATFAVAGLQVSGVPVHREGAYLIVPSGAWSVADSCSGIAYLRTVTMLSILYAWSMYRFFPKRLLFVAGGILLGITGNWLRAYLTILIAHVSDNRFLRDDHSTFGWVLFAILLFVYCAIGYRFRDSEQNNEDVALRQADAAGRANSPKTLINIICMAIAAVAIWPVLHKTLLDKAPTEAVDISDVAEAPNWTRVALPVTTWTPTLTNPTRQRVQSFEKGGRRVDVFIGIFQNQTWTSKLVTVVNGFALQENPVWNLAVRGTAKTELGNQPLEVESGVVLGKGARILAWKWYWIHGKATSSDSDAKIAQLLAHVRSLPDTAAWVAVYADATASTSESTALLDEFMREMGTSVQQSLNATAK